jgi:hypothetical protein
MMASYVGSGRGPQASVVRAGDSTMVVLGTDTVIIRSVEMVMREIELERADAPVDCDMTPEGRDDACEEFTVGIQVVPLPLGNSTDKVIELANVPEGLYDQVEFDIHKPESSNDATWIAAHPDFDGISIRVAGTFHDDDSDGLDDDSEDDDGGPRRRLRSRLANRTGCHGGAPRRDSDGAGGGVLGPRPRVASAP